MRMGNRKIQWGDNVGNGNGDFFFRLSLYGAECISCHYLKLSESNEKNIFENVN